MLINNSCDWCQGGAGDLFYNRQGTAFGEIDAKSGYIVVSIFPNNFDGGSLKAYRRVNFCPMCGRRVGRNLDS